MEKTKGKVLPGFLIKLLFLMVFLLCASFIHAQNRVTGTISDTNGEPIIGASVIIQGTANGTVTDLNGNFILQNVPSNSILVISYVGMKTQNISVNGRSEIKVKMEENSHVLDELVVVGYGVQKKSDVTGALAHIDSKDLTAMPVNNAFEGMQGKSAGVDITNSQRPGTVGSITIRGQRSISASSDPLYVVDGMIMQNNGIDGINPQDIESIEVLKDASATAIYGARGANGVVIVTTKKGKAGKVSINYSGTVTISSLHDVTKMMTASQWIDYARQAYYNAKNYGDTTQPFAANYDLDKKFFGASAGWYNINQAWVDGVYHPELVGSYDWASKAK